MDIHAGNLVSSITAQREYMNPALQRIADYILQNPEQCKTITTKQLAGACGVAESTVTRFVREIGLESFRDFKILLAESLLQAAPTYLSGDAIYDSISRTDSQNDIVDKVFYRTMQNMKAAREMIRIDDISRAVTAICDAKCLIFVGTGSSSVAAEEAIVRFSRAGKRCVFWRDGSMSTMASATANTDDLIIAISDTGRTASVVSAVEHAARSGAASLAITSDGRSPLATAADIVLQTPPRSLGASAKEPWESTTAKTSQLFLIDILYVCYAMSRFDETVENLEKTREALKNSRL